MKQQTAAQKPRLLVADDDPLILFTLVEGLTEAGFDVLQARDGLKAETKVPFLFLSAFSDETYVKQAVAAGAYGYLLKPLSVAAVIPTIRTALARTREDARLQARQEQFDLTLESNRLIATAVGIIMRDHGMDQEDAFEHVRARARRERVKLNDLAQRIVAQHPARDHS